MISQTDFTSNSKSVQALEDKRDEYEALLKYYNFMQVLKSVLDEDEIWVLKRALSEQKIRKKTEIESISQFLNEHPNETAEKLLENAKKELEILCRVYQKIQGP